MSTELAIRFAAAIAFAYLIGGIPWALIIGKRFYGIDPRQHGSGNLGATNVFRTLGARAAIFTLLLDAAKGSAAVGVAWALVPTDAYGLATHQWALVAATMAAIAGHAFSPYIGFKGGKGVATAAGAILVVTPLPWPILLLTFLAVVAATRYVSLGSIVIAIEYPVLVWVMYPDQTPLIVFAFTAASLVLWLHRANMVRLVRGQESKISIRRRGGALPKDASDDPKE